MTEKRKLPRGLRNNNPGNIRHSSSKWKGMSDVQRDSAFVTFESRAYGYRALLALLRTYIKQHRLRNIARIIGRWAPPEDNNDTEAYIQRVCELTGFDRTEVIRWNDPIQMIALAEAISHVENGVPAVRSEVQAGWRLFAEDYLK